MEAVSTDEPLEVLLQKLDERERDIRGKVRDAYAAADKEAEQPLKSIDYVREVLAQIKANPFLSCKKEIHPNPSKWCITFPPEYSPNPRVMAYTEAHHAQFEQAIGKGNAKMDKIIGIYAEGAKKAVISHLLAGEYYSQGNWGSKEYGVSDHPVIVSWYTFALPNFLHAPLLGSKIDFWHAVDKQSGHLNGREYQFRIVHKEDKMVPVFYCKESGRDQTFLRMDAAIKEDFELIFPGR